MKPNEALKKLYLWAQTYVDKYSSIHESEEELQAMVDEAYHIVREALNIRDEKIFNANEIMAKIESNEFEYLGKEANHIKNHLQNIHNKESRILEENTQEKISSNWVVEDNVVRFIGNDNIFSIISSAEDDE